MSKLNQRGIGKQAADRIGADHKSVSTYGDTNQ